MAASAYLLLIALLLPFSALAGNDCYSDFLVVDQIVDWDFSQPNRLDLVLPSHSSQYEGVRPTQTVAHIVVQDNQIQTIVKNEATGMGQSYSVYRVDFLIGNEGDADYFPYSDDLTKGCTSTRYPMLFPSRYAVLFPGKIPPTASGAERGRAPVRVRIWGRRS